MKIGNLELAVVKEAAEATRELAVKELSDLELSLVGGGCGDVVIG